MFSNQTTNDNSDKILEFAKDLQLWQKDALRRIVVTGLNQDDKDYLYNAFLYINKIISNDFSSEYLKPLSKENFKSEIDYKKIILNSISNLKGVNRIKDDQKLSFALEGVTLIYGLNGSGKSGHFRALKKICRSRSEEKVLGNIYDEKQPEQEIVVSYSNNDDIKTIDQKLNESFPDELSTISTFDSKISSLYLTKDNELKYTPYLIKILQEYSLLLDEFNEKLKEESIIFNNKFTQGTNSYIIYDKLEKASSEEKLPTLEDIEKNAILEDNFEEEQKQLENKLKNDPNIIASRLEILNKYIISLNEKIKNMEGILNKDSRKEAEFLLNEYKKAYLEYDNGKKLNYFGIKDDAIDSYIRMLEYAQEFYTKNTGSDSKVYNSDICPFCKQSISDPKKKYDLKNLYKFIEDKLNENKDKKLKEIENFQRKLLLVDIEYKSIEALLDSYKDIYNIENLKKSIIKTFRSFNVYRDIIIAPLLNLKYISVCFRNFEFPSGTISSELLSKNIEDISAEISKLKNNDSFDKDRELLIELKDKELFSKDKDNILLLYNKKVISLKKLKARNCLKTAKVTSLITELNKDLVTNELGNKICEEIKKLKIDYIPVSFNNYGKKGATVFSIGLNGAKIVCSNSDVLSEGERGALSLAVFLAEIDTYKNQNGIIIDDPVSSLDHERIGKIAERLVDEAKKRQVIIFTHNILFYNYVCNECTRQQVKLYKNLITKDDKDIGVIEENEEPMQTKNSKKRIEEIKKYIDILKPEWSTFSNDEKTKESIYIYNKLRPTLERIVEEVLLNGVVTRYVDSVKTTQLNGVFLTDDDYRDIYFKMKKFSEYTAHDKAADKDSFSILDIESIKKDAEDLESLRKKLDTNRKILVEKRNDMIEKPPKAEVK